MPVLRPVALDRLAPLGGAVLLVLAGAAAAAPPAPDLPPKTVAPVTVMPPGDPPKLVGTFPAEGQVIAPGALVVRLTFDQKMEAEGVAFAGGGPGLPNCLKTPRLLSDGKTFVLLCTTAPESRYALPLNGQGVLGLRNLAGKAAVAAELNFSTNGDPHGPHDLEAALKAARLDAQAVPIATQP